MVCWRLEGIGQFLEELRKSTLIGLACCEEGLFLRPSRILSSHIFGCKGDFIAPQEFASLSTEGFVDAAVRVDIVSTVWWLESTKKRMTLLEQMHIVSGVPVEIFACREGRAPVRLIYPFKLIL